MKRFLCLAFCVAAFVSCTNVKREKELTAQNDSLTVALNEKNRALDQAMLAIADIQEGFRAINEAEDVCRYSRKVAKVLPMPSA